MIKPDLHPSRGRLRDSTYKYCLLRGSYGNSRRNKTVTAPCLALAKQKPGRQRALSNNARLKLLAYNKHHFDRQAVLMTMQTCMRHKATCVELLQIPTASRRLRKTRPNFVLTDLQRA